jgi:hypothetical protein
LFQPSASVIVAWGLGLDVGIGIMAHKAPRSLSTNAPHLKRPLELAAAGEVSMSKRIVRMKQLEPLYGEQSGSFRHISPKASRDVV